MRVKRGERMKRKGKRRGTGRSNDEKEVGKESFT
jgi:hypothetical protein